MLLHRLIARTRDAGAAEPEFFRNRPVRWQLALTAGGDPASTELTDLADPSDKSRRNGTTHRVPHTTRTVAVAPRIGADEIQYVLGWCDSKARPDRVERCHAAYAEMARGWAAACPEDPAAAAVARFYASGHAADITRPEGWTSGQLVLISVDGEPVTGLPSLRGFWTAEVVRRKARAEDGEAARGLCLVCGRQGTLLSTFPQLVPRRLVPMAGNDASLVSGNKPIHTYDFSTGLSTVPICVACGTTAVTSLTDVLSDPASHLSYGDSSLAWWTAGSRQFDLAGTLAVDDPESVRSLVERVRRTGTWPHDSAVPDLDASRFCAVTVGGSAARVMIRDWIDMPLRQLETNIAAWFADHAMDSGNPAADAYYPLWMLLLSTGRWIPAPGRAGGRYADLGARNSGRLPDAGRHLLRAALLRAALPSSLPGHLISRIRADRHVDAPRAALLRLILSRSPLPHTEVPMTGLDPDNRDPAYLAGRIFAVLEQIQRASGSAGAGKTGASEAARPVNASFTDRYFSGAVANPRIALIQGQQLAQAWLKKLSRTRPGAAAALRQQLTDLFDRFDATAGLPGQADLASQAVFILGYHQQRADSRRRATAARTAPAAEPEPAPEGTRS